jgi:hypothetical protein
MQKIGADHATGDVRITIDREDAADTILDAAKVYRFAKGALVKSEQSERYQTSAS